MQGEGGAKGQPDFMLYCIFKTRPQSSYIVNVAQPHVNLSWCYLTLTFCLPLCDPLSHSLSFYCSLTSLSHFLLQFLRLNSLVYLHIHTDTHTKRMLLLKKHLLLLSSEAESFEFFLNSFITRGNVDMASFPNHNNRLPITTGNKKQKAKWCFSELNVPKQSLIPCCSRKDRHRLLFVKLRETEFLTWLHENSSEIWKHLIPHSKMVLHYSRNMVSSVLSVAAIPVFTTVYRNVSLSHQKGQRSTFNYYESSNTVMLNVSTIVFFRSCMLLL